MKNQRTLKIIGTVAVVGAIAALATINIYNNSAHAGSSSFLADSDDETEKDFQNYLSKNNKNYLTKEEYNTRYRIFATNAVIIKEQND